MSADSTPHSMCPICEGAHDDHRHVERVIQLAEQEGRWHLGGADVAAIGGLVEQLEAARDYEKAAGGLSADVSRLGRALQDIIDLDPRVTEDGYNRGEDSLYEDEVGLIALAALRGAPFPARDANE